MIELKLWLHLLFCTIIFFHCFCRQQTSSAQTTRADVRTAFGALASGSLWFGIMPLAPAWWPGPEPYITAWPDLILLGSIALVQTQVARQWQHGVPKNFQKCSL